MDKLTKEQEKLLYEMVDKEVEEHGGWKSLRRLDEEDIITQDEDDENYDENNVTYECHNIVNEISSDSCNWVKEYYEIELTTEEEKQLHIELTNYLYNEMWKW